jgi:hypothetical protein
MQTNIIKARLRSITQEIEKLLEQGQQVIFQGRAFVVRKIESDNQDGTVNTTFELKPEIIDFRALDTKGNVTETVQSFVKEVSRSQKLRRRCFMISQELGVSEQALYNSAMDEANYYLDRKTDELKLSV